jgi:pimeloyl-ACP methyl ester carboxylesterase
MPKSPTSRGAGMKCSILSHEHPPIKNIGKRSSLPVPALVIGGRKDIAVPIRQQETLAATVPSARKLLFDDYGHMVAYEQENILEAIRKLLLDVLDT